MLTVGEKVGDSYTSARHELFPRSGGQEGIKVFHCPRKSAVRLGGPSKAVTI